MIGGGEWRRQRLRVHSEETADRRVVFLELRVRRSGDFKSNQAE